MTFEELQEKTEAIFKEANKRKKALREEVKAKLTDVELWALGVYRDEPEDSPIGKWAFEEIDKLEAEYDKFQNKD